MAKTGQNLKLCDFPADLVAKILERLSSADRIRFGAACKNNLSLVTTTKHSHQYQFRAIDKLPWLAKFNCHCPDLSNLTLEFSLFDPLHIQGQPNYATYIVKDPKGEGFGSWDSTALGASIKGWLFCLWAKQKEGKETGFTSFLLFSPFNKRIVKLPDLDHSFVNRWRDLGNCQATFSSDPSSTDCIYFFGSHDSFPGTFSINTLDHQTSKEWKTIVFDNPRGYVSSVVYHEGLFYCLYESCRLVQQSWKLIIDPYSLSHLCSRTLLLEEYMVVCEGKVIVVVLHRKPLECEAGMNCCWVFEFCSFTRSWVRKTSLGNHALFVGHSSFSVPVSSSSCSDNIADRVYFFNYINDHLGSFYYSLKDGQCHSSGDTGYWSSDGKTGIWIETPSCLTGSPTGLA